MREGKHMNSVTPDFSVPFTWSAPITRSQQQNNTRKGIIAIIAVILFIFFLYLLMPVPHGQDRQLWIFLIPIGVILLVAVPLLLLQANASSPHETYTVDDVCVKTGYGRAAIFTVYKKVKSVRVTSRYIELDDGSRTNHVRLPDSNGGQISDYILSRLPETAVITRFNV